MNSTTQPLILTTTYKHNTTGDIVEVVRVSTRNGEVKFYSKEFNGTEALPYWMNITKFDNTYTIWGN